MDNYRYVELRPDLWPALEQLFQENGACGGCWCQWWRVEHGGKLWNEIKGEAAKARMKELTKSGQALGILAFGGDVPVGWCSFGPRAEFPRLETVKAFRRDDTAGVWCVNCFFIHRAHRGQGIARGLLDAALQVMERRRVKTIEAYPVIATKDGKRLAPAFSFTGPIDIFTDRGFEEIQRLTPSKPLLRLQLKR
jgi:GNAT superfamily N-acetyltransferase